MRKRIKIVLTTMAMIIIGSILNINLVSAQQGWGLFWHWPWTNWWWGWGVFWWWNEWGWNWWWWNWWWMSLWNNQTIYNTDITKVLGSDYNWAEIDNPLPDWAYWIVSWEWWSGWISWLVWTETEITQHSDALNKILKIIQNIVNYALGILAWVALVYLIIHWLIILTAAGDDTKTKKWYKWIKNAFIAITWIGLSRMIIRFILRIIATMTA